MNKISFSLLVLISSVNLWTPASYQVSHLQEREEITFPLSDNPEERTTIVLQGKNLLIRGLPGTEQFNYVILKLVSAEDTLPVKRCRNLRKETYDVKFSLKDVSNGSYFIEIYSSPKKYGTYFSYIHGQSLQIRVSDSSIDFIEPLTLSPNKEVFAANRQDRDTLAYYLKASPEVQSDDPVIREYAKTITAEASTDYDKIKAVHDWVSSNIWYDYDQLNAGIPIDKSAIEILISRKGVCIDYASLTAALLRAAGVPAKLVAGYTLNDSSEESWTDELMASNKVNHVWNEAYADGRWIILDTTYDSNNKYKNGTFSTGTGIKNRKYFDISIEFLSADRYIVPSDYDPVKHR